MPCPARALCKKGIVETSQVAPFQPIFLLISLLYLAIVVLDS
jgi:hypothetical protein